MENKTGRSLSRGALAAAALAGLVAVTLPAPASATTAGRDGLLAYVRAPIGVAGGFYTLDLHDPAGTPTKLAAGHAASHPRFNPYGKQIAYDEPTTGAILAVRTSGGASTPLYTPLPGGPAGSEPAWSPPNAEGGQQLAVVLTPRSGAAAGRSDVWLIKTDRGAAVGAPTRLTSETSPTCGVRSPDWSPDGTQIVYRRVVPDQFGHCFGDYPSQVVVRTLRTGTSVVLPGWPRPEDRTPSGPVRFTSDGTSVVVGRALDPDCTEHTLAYVFATESYKTLATAFVCDHYNYSGTVPTPAGGLARVLRQSGYEPWVSWSLQVLDPSGRVTDGPRKEINPEGGSLARDLDVQPLRPRT